MRACSKIIRPSIRFRCGAVRYSAARRRNYGDCKPFRECAPQTDHIELRRMKQFAFFPGEDYSTPQSKGIRRLMHASTGSLSESQIQFQRLRILNMLKTTWFKLASRIACLAILMSAALWLKASARAETSFTCILSQNTKTGACVQLSCGSSAGNTLWVCPPGGGQCTSDPEGDWSANRA
jgi:hypothetical protein